MSLSWGPVRRGQMFVTLATSSFQFGDVFGDIFQQLFNGEPSLATLSLRTSLPYALRVQALRTSRNFANPAPHVSTFTTRKHLLTPFIRSIEILSRFCSDTTPSDAKDLPSSSASSVLNASSLFEPGPCLHEGDRCFRSGFIDHATRNLATNQWHYAFTIALL